MSQAQIKSLLERAASELAAGRALLEEHEGKAMPPDVERQVDAHFDEAERLKAQADRLHKAAQLDKALHDPVRPHPFGAMEPGAGGDGSDRLRAKAFTKFLRHGREALEPEEAKALSSLSDPEGGVLVSEEFRMELIRKRRDLVQIRQRATVLETSSGSVGFPTFDYDGDAEWTPESRPIAEEDITNAFGKTAFTPHKLARIFRVPAELAEDAAINVESLITDHFAMRFGEIEENAFLNGTGVEQPLGLLQAGLPSQSAAGGSIQGDDAIDTVYAIRAVYRQRAVWIVHRTFVREVRKLRDDSGGAGTGAYLWQPGLQAGEPSTLAGYPLLESEFFPAYAAAGAPGEPWALFGDLSFYWIVDRVGFSVQRLLERYAEYDQVGVKLRQRVDAAPVLRDPFVILTRGA